ncbi:MAG: hypothetical protein IJ767_05900 [Bacteroidaceae bacterium]|nr:hypothetical protein [Bacteroidaceae bacterium]
MERHLISLDEFKVLARPASVHIDEGEVMAFVREAEDLYVKPLIGIDTFTTLAETQVPENELTEPLRTLYLGGTWTKGSGAGAAKEACGCGEMQECAGLKRAVAYLAYARMVAADGGMLTRTGYYQHDDSYASRMDDKNRANARRDVQNMADFYLGQCVELWNNGKGCSRGKTPRGTLVRIKSVGKLTE